MVKENQIDVEPEHLKLIKKILKRHITYKTVWAYGSRVNWTANQFSDLDLVVFEVNSVKLGELKEGFAESDLPFSVDVMPWEKIPENFKSKISKKYVVLQKKPELEGWKEYILDDVIEKFIDYRGKTPKKTEYGIPLVTAKIVKAGRILEPNEFISVKDYDSWMTRGFPEIDDIVLTTEAPLGEIALIKDKNIALAQRIITLRGNKNFVYNPFLKYYFQTSNGQYELQSRSSGTTVFGIKATVLKRIPVFIPPLPVQKAIASVLSSLDDKIDLLHRQNKTLEAMAETLFRQWFVEEAKKDWEKGQLGDVIQLVYGKGLKEEIRTGKGFPVVGSSGIVGYHSDFLAEGPGIVIGRKGTLGKVIYIFENFFPIDTTYYIKSKVNSVGLFYEYFLLKSLHFEDMNSDSAVPGLNRDIALSTEIKIAPLDKLQEFNQYSSFFLEKLNSNNVQISTLEELRNMLLPKLMSGEVRIS